MWKLGEPASIDRLGGGFHICVLHCIGSRAVTALASNADGAVSEDVRRATESVRKHEAEEVPLPDLVGVVAHQCLSGRS